MGQEILIVEDDVGLAELIGELLEEAGFATAAVNTAAEALAWCAAHSPYLMILDYTLPDMNARQLLAEMETRGMARPPFIVSTGRGDERLAVAMMKLGARDYIVKDSLFLEMLPPVVSRVAREIDNENERRRAEAALRDSEERFRELAEALPLVVCETDLTGRINYANRQAFELFGYDREDFARGLNVFQMIAEHQRTQVMERVREILATAHWRAEGREYLGVRKDGGEFPILIYSTPLVRAGQIHGMRNVVVDIAERKRAEEEGLRLQAQLVQAQKMESVGRLAGGVAHDFNNMLGVILGYAELALTMVDESQPLHRQLLQIQSAAQRSADLTRQLLAFARKQTIAPSRIDINQTVNSMLGMLQRLIGEDIDLVWLPAPEVWPVKVDPSQIDQILTNLSANARDAIDGVGKVTIETANISLDEGYCATHPDSRPGDHVLLTVSDTGAGMDRKTQSHLFEPFFTTKEMGKGTGLGLATIYGVVKQNCGSINVYSEPGRGTTFKIYLPRHPDDLAPSPPSAETVTVERGSETILVVEDEATVLQMTTLMLERQGYRVVAAGNPAEALRLAREGSGKIDLLITDVIMPEMNGRELAGKILHDHPGMRCLFMSGYTANVIARHGVLDDGVQFLQKPFSISELGNKVRAVLDLAC